MSNLPQILSLSAIAAEKQLEELLIGGDLSPARQDHLRELGNVEEEGETSKEVHHEDPGKEESSLKNVKSQIQLTRRAPTSSLPNPFIMDQWMVGTKP